MNSKDHAKPIVAEIQWKNLKAGLGWEGTPEDLERGLEKLAHRAFYRQGRYEDVPTYYPVYCAWCRGGGARDAGWVADGGAQRRDMPGMRRNNTGRPDGRPT